MKLVTIKNKYIYKPATPEEKKNYRPNGSHIYAAYTDEKTGETRLIQMTHVIEKSKENKIKSGKATYVRKPLADKIKAHAKNRHK